MNSAIGKAPWHLWVVGIIAVLFNAIGVVDFIMSRIEGAAYMESAGMTPDQVAHYQHMPAWAIAVWAIGVFGAFAASLLLLLRRKLAAPLFVISLAAFLVNLYYTYGLTDAGAIMGQQMLVTSAVIAALLLFFCVYAYRQRKRGILR